MSFRSGSTPEELLASIAVSSTATASGHVFLAERQPYVAAVVVAFAAGLVAVALCSLAMFLWSQRRARPSPATT
jgi:hypothetical protein